MSKRCLFFFITLFLNFLCIADNYFGKQDIARLEKAIAERHIVESKKRVIIDSLMWEMYTTSSPYLIYQKIYEEYKSYNYDTALIFAQKMSLEAKKMMLVTDDSVLDANDILPEFAILPENALIDASIANAFVYLSGGLFKEAYDLLSSIQENFDNLPDDFYFTFSRLLWDLADYSGGDIGLHYDSLAVTYISHILEHSSPADSAQYWYPLAVLDLRQHNYSQAIVRLHTALTDTRNSDHERAVYESTLGFTYYSQGQAELALHHYVNAAIADICSSTYETVALRMVAEILFQQGKTEQAERYIRLAMEDATRYNARHRQVGISQTLPIIEQQYITELSFQHKLAFVLLGVVLVLLIVSIIGVILLHQHSKTMREARKTIDDMNTNLLVANKLKEEMISQFLVGGSQYITANEQYQHRFKELLIQRRYSELMIIPKQVDAHQRRIKVNRDLDEMIIKLYPTFVQDFNALLRHGEQFILKPNELLNTQMRIFALIRLGIDNNDTIAEILDCSINTVYTYKTRVIALSDLSADAFYSALMHIHSFNTIE